jgi:hypothetical protein
VCAAADATSQSKESRRDDEWEAAAQQVSELAKERLDNTRRDDEGIGDPNVLAGAANVGGDCWESSGDDRDIKSRDKGKKTEGSEDAPEACGMCHDWDGSDDGEWREQEKE